MLHYLCRSPTDLSADSREKCETLSPDSPEIHATNCLLRYLIFRVDQVGQVVNEN